MATADQPVPTISTHVLDTERGVPGGGVHVTLYQLGEDGRPFRLTQALTDGDGRVRDLLERPMSAGDYRLEFAPRRTADAAGTGPRTRSSGACARPAGRRRARSYHVPLLLSPFSMTTYRGS